MGASIGRTCLSLALSEGLPRLRTCLANINRAGGQATVGPLFDLAIGADIIYEDSHAPLVLGMVWQLLESNMIGEAVLVSGETREGVTALCKLLGMSPGCASGRCLPQPLPGLRAGPRVRPLDWAAQSVPGIRACKPQWQFRFVL